jgi:hypothetical protein
MTNTHLLQVLASEAQENNQPVPLSLSADESIQVYPNSINRHHLAFLFMAKRGLEKYLYVVSVDGDAAVMDKFEGAIVQDTCFEPGTTIKQCDLIHENAVALRDLFAFTRPVLVGLDDAIGLGDRLGLANPAHLRAVAGTPIKAVLAQQSIRELERTRRTPEEVMDAAGWAAYQEGYKQGFGADADHLKTTDDIDLMVAAGFTMFTIDPGDHVVNAADSLSANDLVDKSKSLPWPLLVDTFDNFISRYENRSFPIADDFTIRPERDQVLRALVKYGEVIAHTVKLHTYFQEQYSDYPAEFELSVDETESVTSPFEHFLVANELKRLGIPLVSLAPRFVGDFEKGIDYRGDLDQFRAEYVKHVKIAEMLGPYKISIHSGSDKFGVYQVIGSLDQGHVHVKTAGTSYLEALRTIAENETGLFREILDFSREQYNTEKASYHVSAERENVPKSTQCADAKLLELFSQDDSRQVLHVTYGKVLTSKNAGGDYLFRDRIYNCLKAHEQSHYAYVQRHFIRHLKPFLKQHV